MKRVRCKNDNNTLRFSTNGTSLRNTCLSCCKFEHEVVAHGGCELQLASLGLTYFGTTSSEEKQSLGRLSETSRFTLKEVVKGRRRRRGGRMVVRTFIMMEDGREVREERRVRDGMLSCLCDG